MHHLSSEHLTALILDPLADRDRLGPRFCAGGYVYQVLTAGGTPLLSGPEFPSERPALFNGQGLPEVFQHTLHEDPESLPDTRHVLGVGLLENPRGRKAGEHHFDARVLEHCDWAVEREADAITMKTLHRHGGWSARLTRTVHLAGATLRSTTLLENAGARELPFRWFAHPFFPLNPDGRCCRIVTPHRLPDNPGFEEDAEGTLRTIPRHPWHEGHYQLVDEIEGREFAAVQRHPSLSGIAVRGDFPLVRLALWANDRTFSPEPFCGGTLAPASSLRWSISYLFELPSQ